MSIESEKRLKKLAKINHNSSFGTQKRLRVKFEPILLMTARKNFLIVKNPDHQLDRLRELTSGI